MKRIASGRVVKRQVRSLAPENYHNHPNLRKKLAYPDGEHPSDENVFLPEDSTEQGFEDNIDPKVKVLMQR